MMSPADHEHAIVNASTRIARAWARPDAPLSRDQQGARVAGPSVPVDGAWMTRRACVEELTFWTRHAATDGITPHPDHLDPDNAADLAHHLAHHARALSGWTYAERCADELTRNAERLEQLTRDTRPTVRLGPCPIELVNPDDTRQPCGGDVRADVDNPDNVTCPHCATTDTIEGWQRRMAATLGHVTADTLAGHLRRIGIRTTPRGIAQRAHRGTIPAPTGTDDHGRHLWDAEAVLRHLIAKGQA